MLVGAGCASEPASGLASAADSGQGQGPFARSIRADREHARDAVVDVLALAALQSGPAPVWSPSAGPSEPAALREVDEGTSRPVCGIQEDSRLRLRRLAYPFRDEFATREEVRAPSWSSRVDIGARVPSWASGLAGFRGTMPRRAVFASCPLHAPAVAERDALRCLHARRGMPARAWLRSVTCRW